ncbi:hypothetical protein AHIS1636_31790 [Arthrobacter mangrovi]|uniref:Uncharacterized protein n=1 Tax=Arthrobacter mangrovi TaxID=2966350 RepID=A0ABQ5MXL4_9MICC|nr:hypothetical protein AHIS1636_31790 [Arthrobacter mangrovi]
MAQSRFTPNNVPDSGASAAPAPAGQTVGDGVDGAAAGSVPSVPDTDVPHPTNINISPTNAAEAKGFFTASR